MNCLHSLPNGSLDLSKLEHLPSSGRRDRLPARGAHGEGARIRNVAVAEGAGHSPHHTADRDKGMLPIGPSIPPDLSQRGDSSPLRIGAPGDRMGWDALQTRRVTISPSGRI